MARVSKKQRDLIILEGQVEKLQVENLKLRKQVARNRKRASKVPEDEEEFDDTIDKPKDSSQCPTCKGPLKMLVTPIGQFSVCKECGYKRKEKA